jgi:hypothetical protein
MHSTSARWRTNHLKNPLRAALRNPFALKLTTRIAKIPAVQSEPLYDTETVPDLIP